MRRPLVLYSVRDEGIVREAIRMPLNKCECSDRKWFLKAMGSDLEEDTLGTTLSMP